MFTNYMLNNPIGSYVSPGEAKSATLAAAQFLPGPIGDTLKMSMGIAASTWGPQPGPHRHGGHGYMGGGDGFVGHRGCTGGHAHGYRGGYGDEYSYLENYPGIPHSGGYSAGEYPGGVGAMINSGDWMNQVAIPFNMLFGARNNFFRPTLDYPERWNM